LSDLFPGPAWPSRTFFGPGKRGLTAHVRRGRGRRRAACAAGLAGPRGLRCRRAWCSPGPENAGKILVLLTAAGPGRSRCSFSQYRLVASWKGLAAAAPAAQQVGDQVLCPGNIATAGREWVGTVTRLGSTDTASYAACSAEPRSHARGIPGL